MSIEYVHAAILLHKAGKLINEESLSSVLTAAGITPDLVRVKALVASLAEVNIDEALKSATMFTPTATAQATTPAQETKAKPATAEEEKKKKDEEEKKKEEAAIEGLGALFG